MVCKDNQLHGQIHCEVHTEITCTLFIGRNTMNLFLSINLYFRSSCDKKLCLRKEKSKQKQPKSCSITLFNVPYDTATESEAGEFECVSSFLTTWCKPRPGKGTSTGITSVRFACRHVSEGHFLDPIDVRGPSPLCEMLSLGRWP